jgi:hypothetical protein
MRDISLPDLHGNEHVIVAERFGNAHTQDSGWESPEWEKEVVDGVELVNEDDFALFGEGVPLVKVRGRGETIAALVFGDSLGEAG